MTNFVYTDGIPAANDYPATDQPNMQVNTNSTSGIIAVDHQGFNADNGGTHNKVSLYSGGSTNGSLPSGIFGATFETLYGSTVTNPLEGDIWFSRGGATGIQLTGPGTPYQDYIGNSFIPGGLGIQWGWFEGTHGGKNYFDSGDTGAVTFSPTFPNAALVVYTQMCYRNNINAPSQTATMAVNYTSLLKTGFTWYYPQNSNQYNICLWLAIGY
jgi:hypothetical protein